MIIEKAYELKDNTVCDGKYKNILFPNISIAMKQTSLPAECFKLMAEITFNDGDFAALCTVNELESQYKGMLAVEPYEIDGIPRKEGEAYYSENGEMPASIQMHEIIKLLSQNE